MGEVYRARDTKLKRDVALKILPDSFAGDPERLARFQREAEVLASLNHPNIAHIYGFEENEGLSALVMELVEGDDLSQLIARGPIPVEDALPIAKQIAAALEAAHQQGVIHRDLKPANIKLRPNGTIKVLDFGLAKLVPASDSTVYAAHQSQAPTIPAPPGTRIGVVMGTTAYMSPEQTRGVPVDKRTDIWSFGCVLYEMLCGRPVFEGATISDTVARVLEREPDWQALPRSTPSQIKALLRRCLQKDQQHRLQHIVDAQVEIASISAAPSRLSRSVSVVAGAGLLAIALLTGTWWYESRSNPVVRQPPVSVIIADFKNYTNDPIFDRTLEPMVRLVLEGADFITAYDRNRIRSTFGVVPPEDLDETAAREIAIKHGLGVVLAGTISQSTTGFEISVKASRTATGNEIRQMSGRATSKEEVLSVATGLAANARRALGDPSSDLDQLLEMRSISTASLDVVRHYATAMESQSQGRYEEARQSFLEAVKLDPAFGLGYQALAVLSRNLGRLQDANKYVNEALRHLDGMTERERFATRGFYYRVTGDYQQCAKEYGEMTARYAGDAIAYNQLALCSSKLRDLSGAVNQMRKALSLFPNHRVFRANLAVYAAYAGDFPTAEKEAHAVQEPTDLATVALAFGQLGQGLLPSATETYGKLAAMSTRGASWSASGLGDLALYEGRFSDASRFFEQGTAKDMASNNLDRAARKLTSLAHTHLLQRRPGDAIAAVEKALAISMATEVRFLAARVLIEAGAIDKAQPVGAALASELPAEPQTYGKIIEGMIALKKGDGREAVRILIDANGLLDTWLGHFELGRAYLEAGALPQADSEFDRCIKRRGEALSLFLDEEPTYGYFPEVYYYQGRAREGLKSEGFAESYRSYLRLREKASEDPTLAEVKRRAG